MGIRTLVSARANHGRDRPSFSEPTATATGPVRSASTIRASAWGVAATTGTDRSASQSSTSGEPAEATGTENTVPLLARTRLGLPQSVTGPAAITAVTPAASAVRSEEHTSELQS